MRTIVNTLHLPSFLFVSALYQAGKEKQKEEEYRKNRTEENLKICELEEASWRNTLRNAQNSSGHKLHPSFERVLTSAIRTVATFGFSQGTTVSFFGLGIPLHEGVTITEDDATKATHVLKEFYNTLGYTINFKVNFYKTTDFYNLTVSTVSPS